MALTNRAKEVFAPRGAAHIGAAAARSLMPCRLVVALAPSLLFGHAFAISLFDASYGLELVVFACTVLAGVYALRHWGFQIKWSVTGSMAALGIAALLLEMVFRRFGAVEYLAWMHVLLGISCGAASFGAMGAADARRRFSAQGASVHLLPLLCALCAPLLVVSAAQRVSATLLFRVGIGPFGPTFSTAERIVIGTAACACAAGALRAARAGAREDAIALRCEPHVGVMPWGWLAAGVCSVFGVDGAYSAISVLMLLLTPSAIVRAVRRGLLADIDAARGLVALAASSVVLWGGQFDSSVLSASGVTLVFLMAVLAGAGVLGVACCLWARSACGGDDSRAAAGPVVDLVDDAVTASPGARLSRLSPREAEVAALLLEGATQATIADELGLSRGTIATYCRRVYEKTGCTGRAEFLRRCIPAARMGSDGAGMLSCTGGIDGRLGAFGGVGGVRANSAAFDNVGTAHDGSPAAPDDERALGEDSERPVGVAISSRAGLAAPAGAGRLVLALFSPLSLVADIVLVLLAVVPGLASEGSPIGCSAASRMVSLACAGIGLCVAGTGAVTSRTDAGSSASGGVFRWFIGPVGDAACTLLGVVAFRRGLPGAFCEQAGLLFAGCFAGIAGARVALRLSLLQRYGMAFGEKLAAALLAPWCAIAAGHVLAGSSALWASMLAIGAVMALGTGASWAVDALGSVDGTREEGPRIGYALTPDVAAAMVFGGCALVCARIGHPPSMWAAPWIVLPALFALVGGVVLRGAGEGISRVRALSACVGWMTAGALLGYAHAVPLPLLPAAILLGSCLAGYARYLSELKKRSVSAALEPAELIRAACAEFGLTEAEAEVAALLAAGFTVDECARRRVVARSTIASQRRSAYAKLGVRTRDELRRHLNARIAAHLGA